MESLKVSKSVESKLNVRITPTTLSNQRDRVSGGLRSVGSVSGIMTGSPTDCHVEDNNNFDSEIKTDGNPTVEKDSASTMEEENIERHTRSLPLNSV